jgi:N-acetylmuramoyl-L-alanine amidase
MMLQEFIKKWDGGAPDFDGAFGAQCVDLARFYIRDVLGFTNPGPVVGAQDFFFNYDKDSKLYGQFQKVINSPSATPERGDVVLFKATPKNQYGHVCVFVC